MTRGFCPSALGLMDNAQNIAIARDFRKCEKYLTLPDYILTEGSEYKLSDALRKFYDEVDSYVVGELNSGASFYSIQRGLMDIQYLKLPLFIPKYQLIEFTPERETMYVGIYQVEGYTGPCGVRLFLKSDDGSFRVIWKSEDQADIADKIRPDVILVNIPREFADKHYFFIICSNTANGPVRQSLLLGCYDRNSKQVAVEKQFIHKDGLDAYYDMGADMLEVTFRELKDKDRPDLLKSYYYEKHTLHFTAEKGLDTECIIKGKKALEHGVRCGLIGQTKLSKTAKH